MAEASSEEAAWRDLIARFAEAPAAETGPRPWPAREDLPVPPPAKAPDDPLMGPLTRPAGPGHVVPAAPQAPAGPSPASSSAAPSAAGDGTGRGAGTPGPGDPGDATVQARARMVRPAAPEPLSPDDEEHYVPPPPPPFPSLDPVAKGAWVALFGGPGYLLLAVMAGWQVPGWAAFLAVAAFVGGFATLVVRMGDQPPRDPGGGAVV